MLHHFIAAELARNRADTPYYKMQLQAARLKMRKPYQENRGRLHDVDVSNLDLNGFGLNISIRIYRPRNIETQSRSLLIFIHGGGFIALDACAYDGICSYLCAESEFVVASIDYSLAPEHKFPTAIDECFRVVRWFAANQSAIGLSGDDIFIAGDSAGGCLAAVTCLRLCMETEIRPSGLMLWYPVTDYLNFEHESYQIYGEGYGLAAEGMAWFWSLYMQKNQMRNQYATPMQMMISSYVPPCWFMMAEYDILRDEGIAFAERLVGAGGSVRYQIAHGLNHGFLKYVGILDEVTDHLRDGCHWLMEIASRHT